MHPAKKTTGTPPARKSRLAMLAGGKSSAKLPKRATGASEPTSGRIVVPDLPPLRTARWHLLNASILLGQEYMRTRGESERAEDLALASAIARQLYTSLFEETAEGLDDGTRVSRTKEDRASLRKMAHGLRRRPKIDKSDAERWLLEKLPTTATEARAEFPDHPDADAFNADGATNLARWALAVLGAQRHADAARILRRWGIEDPDHILRSAKFDEDARSLASEVRLLMLGGSGPSGKTFGEALVNKMYLLLRLKRPLEAMKKKRRR